MDQHELETMVRQGRAVDLVGAACLTVLIYDHLTTLDQEIQSIWRARLSLAKVLFLINRYPITGALLFNCIIALKLIYNINSQFCTFFMRWHSVVSVASSITIQGILMLRVWALHRLNKWPLYTAFFFYIGGAIVLITLLIWNYVKEQVILNMTLSRLPGCYAMNVPDIIAGQWITPLIVESVLFFLVIYRAYYWWKEGIAMPKIVALLTRDSVMYFSVVFVMYLANYLMFQYGPVFLSSLLVTPATTVGVILGSHMILNLRETMYGGNDNYASPAHLIVSPNGLNVSINVLSTTDRIDTECNSVTMSHPPTQNLPHVHVPHNYVNPFTQHLRPPHK